MTMYSAAFDESGHPDSGEYMIVAGCVAEVGQWTHFEREWRAVLAPLGLTIFHAVDFDKGIASYGRLSESEAADLLFRLVGIIRRRVEKNFSQVLRLDDYNAINAKYVFSECYGFPYPALARSCMGLVSTWAEKYSIPESNVRHFFENGAKHKGQLEWICLRDHLKSPVFLDKGEFAPLQAGDLMAFCHYHYLSRHGKPEPRWAKAIDHLAEISSDWGLINFKDPDRIPAILGIPPRDPKMHYKSLIVRKDGKRRAVTRFWPKGTVAQPKLSAKNHGAAREAYSYP